MKDVFSDSLGDKKQQPTNRQDILYFHLKAATTSIEIHNSFIIEFV